MAYDNFLIDKRVVERNISKGLVDPEQLKQQIESLPDREANLVHVSLEGGAQASEDTSSADLARDVDDTDDTDDEDDEDEDEGDDDDDDDVADDDVPTEPTPTDRDDAAQD